MLAGDSTTERNKTGKGVGGSGAQPLQAWGDGRLRRSDKGPRGRLGFYTYSESNQEPIASLGSHVMRQHVRS